MSTKKEVISNNELIKPPNEEMLEVINKYLFDKGLISKKIYEGARAEIFKK